MFNKMKKMMSVVTSVVLLLQSTTVYAIRIPASMNDKIVMTCNLLEELLKDDYAKKLDEIKEKAVADNKDYILSMQSLAEKGNVFSDVDYIELIAAYLTVTNNTLSICDIDFFEISFNEESINEPKPYKYFKYEKNEDGSYKKGVVSYLLEDGYIDTYEKNEDGNYKYKGKEFKKLDYEITSYYDVFISVITPEDILNKYGNGKEIEKEEYRSRLEMLKASGISARGLRESIMLLLYQNIILEADEEAALKNALAFEDPNRTSLIKTAVSLIGKVPYEWGGKASKAGYDDTWWLFNDQGEQNGLDCSGFVQWAYWSSGYTNKNILVSTSSILNNCETIPESELKPGDIGLLNHGEKVNHTGIYIGDGYWIHCSSSKNTVIISKFPFTIYKRAPYFDEQTFTAYEYINDELSKYSNEEIYLLSQLVTHEAAGEGINGWVAVTEVVMNRMKSEHFPNSIRDVIYDEGQFENVNEIIDIEPSQSIIACVEATLSNQIKILNREDILFFRNPHGNELDDWGGLKAFTKINNHVFYYK